MENAKVDLWVPRMYEEAIHYMYNMSAGGRKGPFKEHYEKKKTES